MKDTRTFLESLQLPPGDLYSLPDSGLSFPSGEPYRFEVPGIQGPQAMAALLDEAQTKQLRIHRVTQTRGIMTLTDDEISEMVALASHHDVDLVLAVGPRATTDTSASVNTPEGQRIGYRLRGQEQVVRAMEDLRRAADLGCRSFLVYDEGLLWVADRARSQGFLPSDSQFKVSAHMGHGNPASAKVLEELGANSINPVRDIQLQMLAALRASISIPIDIHTENPKSSGGFIRHYEVPEMIRVASPVYLKTGGAIASTHNSETSETEARLRVRQVELVARVISRYFETAEGQS